MPPAGSWSLSFPFLMHYSCSGLGDPAEAEDELRNLGLGKALRGGDKTLIGDSKT